MNLEQKLASRLLEDHPEEAAKVLDRLSDSVVFSLLEDVSAVIAASVLARMVSSKAAMILVLFEKNQTTEIVTRLSPNIAALLIRKVDTSVRKTVLSALPTTKARAFRQLLNYREGTAGALMDPEVLSVPSDMTVREAVDIIQQEPQHVEDYLFVEERNHILRGAVKLPVLLASVPERLLSEVSTNPMARIPAEMDRRAILNLPGWRVDHCLPVVDKQGSFLGAIPYTTLRKLENELQGGEADEGVSTMDALGDLFWTGMTALLGTMAPISTQPSIKTVHRENKP